MVKKKTGTIVSIVRMNKKHSVLFSSSSATICEKQEIVYREVVRLHITDTGDLNQKEKPFTDLGAGSACLTESPDDFDLSSFLSSPAELPLHNQEPEINQPNTTNELAAANGVQFDGHSQRASEGAQEELLASPSVHQREATTPGDVDATSGAARQQRAGESADQQSILVYPM